MKITWLRHACFKIESTGKIIICDPYSSRIGLKLPDGLYADIVTVSHQHVDHNDVSAISGVTQIFDKPGDNESGVIKIKGILAYHDSVKGAERGENIVFLIEAEGIRICHLGDLGHLLTTEQLSGIGRVDVLMIPVGGGVTLKPDEVLKTIQQIKPKIILPMHFSVPERQSRFSLRGVDEFIKEANIPTEKMDELTITREDLARLAQKIVLLKAPK